MRKYLSIFLSAMMITNLLVINVSASSTEEAIIPVSEYISSVANEKTKEKALEQAIKSVKSKVTIPKDYTIFNYHYYETTNYRDGYWRLSWRNEEATKEISVECDNDYNINNYRKYNYEKETSRIPLYLKKDLLDVAEDFIKKLNPKVADKIKFTSAEYEGIYSSTYRYNFQRVENGIDFPDNTVNVRVNGVTGQVELLSINWLYDVKIPNAKTKVTKDEAAKIIANNLNMDLNYRINYYHTYREGESINEKAFLVYQPDKSYISVDARTGKAYLSVQEYIERDSNGTMDDKAEEESADVGGGLADVSLTDEELKRIQELKLLISKEEAIEIVSSNPYLYHGENLIESSAHLGKYYNSENEDTYYWRIELRDPRPVDYNESGNRYRAYSYAQVDAKTGRIISYQSNLNDYYNEDLDKWEDIKIKYNKKESQQILEKFLKKEIGEHFSNSKLVRTNDDHIIYYDSANPIYRGYSYSYNRVNEGVLYSYDGIYGSVDGVTGKIYRFNYNWSNNVDFESPKDAMTPKKAFDHYISNNGYKLVYEVNQKNIQDSSANNRSYQVEYEVRLVYRPDIDPQYISPFTGEQLTSRGEIYKERKAFEYGDISDSKENWEILLLADMNIGFEGDYFFPNRNITYGEYLKLMEGINFRNYKPLDLKESENLTREEISVDIIKRLGLEDIAKLQGIFNPGFEDQEDIKEEYLGAVSLAKGLDIIEIEDNHFKAKDNITRRQVVEIILNYLEIY